MNEQRQIEELARIQGITNVKGCNELYGLSEVNEWYQGIKDESSIDLPNYLTSLDALQPLLLGMSDVQRCEVYRHVSRLCNFYVLGDIFKATPARIAEAILRALDKWENEEKEPTQ